VHCCCTIAHLCEEQISTVVIALAQACCESVVQRSTEKWGSYFALTSAAMHWCRTTAHLYEEQISIGVFASMTNSLSARHGVLSTSESSEISPCCILEEKFATLVCQSYGNC